MVLSSGLVFRAVKCSLRAESGKIRSVCDHRKQPARTFSLSSQERQSLLTPQEVNSVLRANEFSHDFSLPGPVKSYDSNQLPSNNPMEDARAEAKCHITNNLLLGVFDGHAGAACAQVVAKRLFHYLNAALLPRDVLRTSYGTTPLDQIAALETFNEKYSFVQDLREIYENSYRAWIEELLQKKEESITCLGVKKTVQETFERLDQDLWKEAEAGGKPLSVALSGCVACVAHIRNTDLYVASVGDCQAVIGWQSESGQWVARKLSIEHNSDNPSEVERILGEHPAAEATTAIRTERLLGQLAPLRAFGDFRYKWSLDDLERLMVPRYGTDVVPPNYLTPPYLTAQPDVTHYRLSSRDKFLVVASDGLWDLLSPLQVVRLVGEYMRGRVALTPLRLPRSDMTLGAVKRILDARADGRGTVPLDGNAATHLVRHALGSSDSGGADWSKLSHLLSIPQDVVRLFRDDITVTVIYFDEDFVRHSPQPAA